MWRIKRPKIYSVSNHCFSLNLPCEISLVGGGGGGGDMDKEVRESKSWTYIESGGTLSDKSRGRQSDLCRF